MELKQDFSLQELNSFGLDVRARYFLEINSVEGAKEYFKKPAQKKRKNADPRRWQQSAFLRKQV
jgi:UDP-N-acetylenolpyruvoylglucosamine reductase